jgi:hypothetical protein
VLLTAVITRQQMSAQGLCPAVDHIIHSAAMAGQEIRATPLLIGRTRVWEDVHHLRHARAPAPLEVGHEGVDGGVHDVEGFGRQMRVARGGTGTLVAQECWDDAPRHTPLSEMRGIGVPQRVHRGVCGEATLAHHELESLLESGRRERRLLVSRGEQPGPGARPLPVPPSQLQGPFGQGPSAVLAPCALADTDQHALRINVRDLSRRPFP